MATESTVIERLIEQIEQRYDELTGQLADPAVMADRSRHTELARSHRELSAAHALAEEYRRAESNAAGAEELLEGTDGGLDAADRREFQEELTTSRARMEQLAEQLRLEMVERDPNDSKNVIVEIRSGAGGDEARAVRRRPLPDADQVRGAAQLQDRGPQSQPLARGWLQGRHVRGQGRRRIQRVQVRGRGAPCAARARDRVAGADPHLDRDGGGAARGGGRRGRSRPERPPDRRLPLIRPGRPVA